MSTFYESHLRVGLKRALKRLETKKENPGKRGQGGPRSSLLPFLQSKAIVCPRSGAITEMRANRWCFTLVYTFDTLPLKSHPNT